MIESCKCVGSVSKKAALLTLTGTDLFRPRGCGVTEARLSPQTACLHLWSCTPVTYRSKDLPQLQALGGNGMEWLMLARISGALTHTACFSGLVFGDPIHPGNSVLSDYSTAAFPLSFEGREVTS